MESSFKRGEVYYVDFGKKKGSVQSGRRPAVVLQNPMANRHGMILTVAPITTVIKKLPVHVTVKLDTESQVLIEQITTVSKNQVKGFICKLTDKEIEDIDSALDIQLWLGKVNSPDSIIEMIEDLEELIFIYKKTENNAIRHSINIIQRKLKKVDFEKVPLEFKRRFFKVYKYRT